MRAFDWVQLFQKKRVHFVERGANVKRGEVNIKCPWCGTADPSEHMGINLTTGWYSCWRNKRQHSGKSPLRLIMKLLRVSYEQARELAGLGDDYVDPEGFDALAARLMGRTETKEADVKAKREHLEFDKHFLDITSRPLTARWWNYIYSRGFDDADIPALCAQYQLRAARDGHYALRLIIPYFLEGQLVTWTGRAIARAEIRYKDLPIDLSVLPPKETLYNHDCINEPGGKVLVLVEGPLDALKLDYYGKRFGVRAVGLSTNSITESQMFMLEVAAAKFERVVVMQDNKTGFGTVDSMRLKGELSFLPNLEVVQVPYRRGDPGEMLPNEVELWAENQTKEQSL